MSEVHSDLTGAWLSERWLSFPIRSVDGSLLCLLVQAVWPVALLEPSMEGGLEALPVIEPSGSDVEISVDPSTQCGFMV